MQVGFQTVANLYATQPYKTLRYIHIQRREQAIQLWSSENPVDMVAMVAKSLPCALHYLMNHSNLSTAITCRWKSQQA
jgi:hypothetical protein